MQVRPMRHGDVVEAERLSAAALNRPGREPRPAWSSAIWVDRAAHLLAHDAPGCWVAEDDDGLLGLAVSFRRDTMWGLASLFVRVGDQGRGVGATLMERALSHSVGCTRGMICASTDPKALRRYHAAGFTLHPTMQVSGPIDRALLPVVEHVRDGSVGDRDLLDSVDRQARGAAHGVDHAFMVEHHPLVVSDSHLGSGYCYLTPAGVYLLAATSERTASALLWEAMARTEGETFAVREVTGAQAWLVDVAMRARLTVSHDAFLALRFLGPPATYVPSPHFM